MTGAECRPLWLVDLGHMAYRPAWELQHVLVERRIARQIPDTLLLVEHDPVITLGRRADPANVLVSAETLRAVGVDLIAVERGGDVTYHGPGQLVGYPIVHLPALGLGASDLMHTLEDAIAATLRDYGLATLRREGVIGVGGPQQDRRAGRAHPAGSVVPRVCAQRGARYVTLVPDRSVRHPRWRRHQHGDRVGLGAPDGRGTRADRSAPGRVAAGAARGA